MILKLRAQTEQDIIRQLPWEMYATDEQGNEHFIPATTKYSYVFVGKEVDTEATYNENGELVEPATYTGKVLVDLQVLDGSEIDFKGIEIINPVSPSHGWC